jgi:hypothetical protein
MDGYGCLRTFAGGIDDSCRKGTDKEKACQEPSSLSHDGLLGILFIRCIPEPCPQREEGMTALWYRSFVESKTGPRKKVRGKAF